MYTYIHANIIQKKIKKMLTLSIINKTYKETISGFRFFAGFYRGKWIFAILSGNNVGIGTVVGVGGG